jgi:hypothetical protein
VLCLAENAIGPDALRNDDVVTGFSGLTCEINNSDAEGRLVLADGVAHATALPPLLPGLDGNPPELIVDMATLTGAQLVATGKRHAGIVSNLDEVERDAVAAGRLSGDTVHPLPFVPEVYRHEFKSQATPRPPRARARATRDGDGEATRTRIYACSGGARLWRGWSCVCVCVCVALLMGAWVAGG